ncbi:MAG: NAD(P)/FAD-dependent oxidoreductase [Desulfobacteraceae bacterium]|nr:NAD(P)/FAD-dependent oxidoreductase [Desulfobacteraceae bacterium]
MAPNADDRTTGDIAASIPVAPTRRLVIVGGGFAGLYLAKKLGSANLQIVLLDRNNFHTFQPLLYQVATAMLEPESVANAFRNIFQGQKNFHFRMVDVLRIDPGSKGVVTSAGRLGYDYLVIATGAATNFFGMQDMAKHAFVMKEISQSIAIRQQIFRNLEKALMTAEPTERERLMNIVIVGGGPTGIELAGAIGELKKFILPEDYPELDFRGMRITLVEATDRLLNGMSERASRMAHEALAAFDVTFRFNTRITGYDGQTATTAGGEALPTELLIWVAGVSGAPPLGLDRARIAAGGRITVDCFNLVPEYENIFAIGDVAAMITPTTPHGHPMLAPVAIQQAENLARNLAALNLDPAVTLTPFGYKNHGLMATIGRNRAIVERKRLSFGGLPAWLAWLFVHLMSIVGFRNKLVALTNWAWNYLSYDRGMRLIISFSRNHQAHTGNTKTRTATDAPSQNAIPLTPAPPPHRLGSHRFPPGDRSTQKNFPNP